MSSSLDLVLLGNPQDRSLTIFGTPEDMVALGQEIIDKASEASASEARGLRRGTMLFLPDATPNDQESGFRLFGFGVASAEDMEKLREQALVKAVKEKR